MKKQLTTLFFTFYFFLMDPFGTFFTLLNAQNISTVAGNNSYGPGYSGDGGAATTAELNAPYSIAFDRSGNMYVADQGNQVIRKVDYSTRNISTVAGNNGAGSGYSGDGSAATLAELYNPTSVAIDDSGNIYTADTRNYIIRKVDHTTGIISTVAGNYAFGAGYSGDGSPATTAELDVPAGIAIDHAGNLFIADANNNVIRKVDHSSSTISTVAGSHAGGYSGDGSPATACELNHPTGVSVDTLGTIFIADYNNQVIRKVGYMSGNISTVAGNHSNGAGYSGDGGPAVNAELDYPWGIKVDGTGNLFIADQFNSVIREVYNSNGNIGTIAGNYAESFGFSGDGGPATNAELFAPVGVAIDSYGNLFIADLDNNVVRKVNSVTVGIENIALLPDEIAVYPNPNNGKFTVEMPVVRGQVSVEVYNVFGEKVLTPTLPAVLRDAPFTCYINISSQPDGIYFLKIINESGSICKKVVLEK